MTFQATPAYFQGLSLLKTLQNQGYEAYFVGGCVRDSLLGKEVEDFDISTSATPDIVVSLFPNTVDTGSKWGTITVILQGIPFEVTTFRGEGTYSDGRHPDQVSFGVSLEEDLKRRDFTINAMAYTPEKGLLDPFSGEMDLQCKTLRCVGEAQTRFSEDALRILRALRFSATLDLVIIEETADALLCSCFHLNQVTLERKTNELRKMVMGDFLGRISHFYPVLEEGLFYGIDCLWEAEDERQLQEKLEAISSAPKILPLRLAMFLSNFDAEIDLLRLSKEEGSQVEFLCQSPCLACEGTDVFYKFIRKYGKEKVSLLLIYQKYFHPYSAPILEGYEDYLQKQTCTSLKELAINGNDLLALGVKGEMIGKLLQISMDYVLAGTVTNDKTEILPMIFGEDYENKDK